MNNKRKIFLLKVLIHISAFVPILNLYYQAYFDLLGVDPVEEVIHFTGIGAFNLLLISLLISPIAQKFKQGFLLQVRRLVGLYAFFYALLHLFNFLAFDIQFDIALFVSEILDRPYITIGMLAFTFLFLLAVTSISFFKRKMGKSWQKLHNVIYIIVLLVAVHFYWSVKSDLISPLFYFFLTSLLLGWRYKKIRQLLLQNST